jgi:hypothetical protein
VIDSRGDPAAGQVVLVFPVDPGRRQRPSRSLGGGLSKRDGGFETRPLPPGAYYVAAIGTQESFGGNRDAADPAFLESLVAGATRVTLGEGQSVTVSVKLIPTP